MVDLLPKHTLMVGLIMHRSFPQVYKIVILNIGFILEVNQNKEAVVHKENMDMILIHASGNMVEMEIMLQFLKEKYGL